MADTPRETEPVEGPAWAAARAWGCDMPQLAHLLTLSVRERLLRHDRALSSLQSLRAAVEAERARS